MRFQRIKDHATISVIQFITDIAIGFQNKVKREQLVWHSHNGKPMKSATMLAMLEQLGVRPSFSRPSVSDDDPYSESLFKTVKYHPTLPIVNRFDSIEAVRIWMESFAD